MDEHYHRKRDELEENGYVEPLFSTRKPSQKFEDLRKDELVQLINYNDRKMAETKEDREYWYFFGRKAFFEKKLNSL